MLPLAGPVHLNVSVTNTGNITLKGVMLDLPHIFMSTLACFIGSQPYQVNASLLQPGAVLTCGSTSAATLSDIEDGDHMVTVTATAPTVDLSVSKDVLFVARWRPEVSVEFFGAECSSIPAKAGALTGRSDICSAFNDRH